MEQFFKVVDKEKTEVRWQSEWFSRWGLSDVIKLTSKFTVAQFLAREDFSKRYSAGRPIAITELLYPLLQAYDSVVIGADVEFGGIDQKFNCLVGRELQVMMGQPPQQLVLMPLLIGTDGSQKMSKSLGNYIAINEPPPEIYGKVMSIPDSLIMDYFELVTDVPEEELAGLRHQMDSQLVNPMLLKKRLAREIVAQFHSLAAAQEAEEHFARVFQRREVPEEVVEYWSAADYVADGLYRVDIFPALLEKGLVRSRGELKRLLSQGAIEEGGRKLASSVVDISNGSVLKVGKRGFLRIIIDENSR